MAELTSYTKPLTQPQAERLRALLEEKDFRFEEKPYMLFSASKNKVNIAVYTKGPKIVVQGRGTEDFVKFLLEPEVLGTAELGYEEVHHPEMFEPHIGVDESGKGDFFGPLVIAGVYVDREVTKILREIGAVDSKRIGSDTRIQALAEEMRSVRGLVYEVIVIGPERYNELHTKFGNLNKLLAWGHARVIENLLERVPDCPRALSDKFASEHVLEHALQQRGKKIIMEQRTKAESDPAVAAASIFAREKFVRWLDEAGKRYGITFPKGVSEQVKAAARLLITQHHPDTLSQVAKMHFRTSAEVRP